MSQSPLIPEELEDLGEPAPPRPSRTRVRAVMVGAIVLFVVLAALGLSWTLGAWNRSPQADSTTPSATAGPRSTNASGGGATTSGPGKVAQTPSGVDTRLRVDVPSGARSCGGATASTPYAVKAGNRVTSCGFARAVRAAYDQAAPNGGAVTVRAVSPTTGKKYAMTCTDTLPILCTGGNGAIVYLIPSA